MVQHFGRLRIVDVKMQTNYEEKKKQQPRAHHYFIGRWWEMFILLLEIIFKITQLVAGRNWSMSIEWCEFVNQSLLHVYMNCVFSYSFCNNDLFNKTSAFFSCIEALSSCKNREFNGEKKIRTTTRKFIHYFIFFNQLLQYNFTLKTVSSFAFV